MVVSRQVVGQVATALKKLDAETAKEISYFTLNNLQTRAISFEEQVKNWETNYMFPEITSIITIVIFKFHFHM